MDTNKAAPHAPARNQQKTPAESVTMATITSKTNDPTKSSTSNPKTIGSISSSSKVGNTQRQPKVTAGIAPGPPYRVKRNTGESSRLDPQSIHQTQLRAKAEPPAKRHAESSKPHPNQLDIDLTNPYLEQRLQQHLRCHSQYQPAIRQSGKQKGLERQQSQAQQSDDFQDPPTQQEKKPVENPQIGKPIE